MIIANYYNIVTQDKIEDFEGGQAKLGRLFKRPLPVAQFQKDRCQIKDGMDIIIPLIPYKFFFK